MNKLKEIIRKKLKEMSATGNGGASFSSGEGEAIATPFAFNKNKSAKGTSDKYYYKLGYKEVTESGADLGPGPKAGPEGVKDNYYVKAFNYKLVPKKIKGSGLEVKQLWKEDQINELNDFQKKRIDSLDEIETLMNEIRALVSDAKNETVNTYSGDVGSYDIVKPIETVKSYLNNIKQILLEK
jgi:hypothetical protein